MSFCSNMYMSLKPPSLPCLHHWIKANIASIKDNESPNTLGAHLLMVEK